MNEGGYKGPPKRSVPTAWTSAVVVVVAVELAWRAVIERTWGIYEVLQPAQSGAVTFAVTWWLLRRGASRATASGAALGTAVARLAGFVVLNEGWNRFGELMLAGPGLLAALVGVALGFVAGSRAGRFPSRRPPASSS